MLKRLFCFSLCLVMLLAAVPTAFAEDSQQSGTMKLLSYNVQGLINSNYAEDYPAIAEIINSYDLAAVQEDFNFHYYLKRGVTLPYMTKHSGVTSIGDGLNFFSNFPLHCIGRVPWNNPSGILNGGNDALTPKGFLYSTVEVAEGAYIDFYNIHTDGFEDEFSIAAKRDNIKQLAAFVNEHSAERAVIIIGDTNMRLSRKSDGLNELLLAPCGLTDAWAQICNEGRLPAFGEFDIPNWWGNVDSIDRVMYRNGGGVELEALTHEYITYKNSDGRSYSDHAATAVEMQFTVTEPGACSLPEEPEAMPEFFRRLVSFWVSLNRLLSDLPRFIRTGGLDELIESVKHVLVA